MTKKSSILIMSDAEKIKQAIFHTRTIMGSKKLGVAKLKKLAKYSADLFRADVTKVFNGVK